MNECNPGDCCVVSRCRTSRIVDENDVLLMSDLISYTTQAYKLSLVIDSTVNVHVDLCVKDGDKRHQNDAEDGSRFNECNPSYRSAKSASTTGGAVFVAVSQTSAYTLRPRGCIAWRARLLLVCRWYSLGLSTEK